MLRMTNIEYLKNHGRCPWCDSTQLEFGDISDKGRNMEQAVVCLDCDKEWSDLYTMIGFQPKE